MSKPRPTYLDSPGRMKQMLKYFSAAHVLLFQLSNGKLGNRFQGVPTCLVTTIGRKSRKPRTKPLLYLADGERVVIVASQGGLPHHPAWYLNLQANPNLLVQTGGHRRPMRARTADQKERDELWPRLVELYPDYADYQSWTDREIPVVICEPA